MADSTLCAESILILRPGSQLVRTNFGALLHGGGGQASYPLSQSEALGIALCGGRFTFAEIVTAMADLYGIEASRVEGELRSLYSNFLGRGLLEHLPCPLPEPFHAHQNMIFVPEERPDAIHPEKLLDLGIQLTRGCILSCAYCFADSGTEGEGPHLPAAVVVRVLEEAGRAGAVKVILGGGEPLIHPDIIPIVRQTVRLGYQDILLSTKATSVTRELAESLRRAGLQNIQVSLDSLSPDEVDALVGRANALPDALQGLFYLHELGFRVKVQAIMTKLNIESFPAMVRTLHRWGIRSFGASRLVLVGRGTRGLLPTEEQVAVLQQELERLRKELKGAQGLTFGDESLTRCGAGRLGCFVLADGRVVGCDLMATLVSDAEILGNVKDQSILDIWNGERMRSFRRPRVNHPICLSCDALLLCTGGCRVRSFIATGDMNAPDPLCTKVYPARAS